MKSVKRFSKRMLSLVICMTMLVTTFCIFDIGTLKTEAAISTESSADLSDVLFCAPEVIYLKPNVNSLASATVSPFQYYVNNTITESSTTPNLTQGENTTGTLYFKYSNASNVKVTTKWYKKSTSTNGIGTAYTDSETSSAFKLSGKTIDVNANGFGTLNIGTSSTTGYNSPSLGASETGCYLEWKVEYHDKADNLDKPIRVVDVKYTDTGIDFDVTVDGRADKIQLVDADGNTRTYSRDQDKVSIKSYAEDGTEVGSLSRELSYEVWSLTGADLPDDTELTAYTKIGNEWNTDVWYTFEVTLENV